MNIENEITILEVDKKDFIKKLLMSGAVEVSCERLQIRCVYDFNPIDPNKWIRLRTNGEKTTLTIKELESNSKIGAKELEIEVSDFEETNRILEKLGYVARNRQENLRHTFMLDDVEISIDTWPMIPPYAEVEAKEVNQIQTALDKLGIGKEQTTELDVVSIYNDIYGIDVMSIKNLTFGENNEGLLEHNK